jgi:hypothetical protein
MATAKQFTCPTCGFNVATPAGMSDLMTHVTMHADTHHPDMQMSEAKLTSMVKDVELRGAVPEKMLSKEMFKPKEESKAWDTNEVRNDELRKMDDKVKGTEAPKMVENKGKYEFDDKLKEGAHKFGDEIKEHGGDLKKDMSDFGSKMKKKIDK